MCVIYLRKLESMKKPGNQNINQYVCNEPEELHNIKVSTPTSQFSKINALKLFHELEYSRKEIELLKAELKRAEGLSFIANEKYADLFDFSPSGYFILSKKGKINELNLCGSQMLGNERSFLKSKTFTFFVSTDTRQVFQLFLKKIFENKTRENCEISLSSDNNEQKYLYLTGLISNDAGQCLINAVNITELKLSNIELLKSKERAEESDRLKTAFLHNMGHEIRTPMNSIIGFSELLINQNLNKTTLEKYAGLIKHNCVDLLQIINNILDIAKIESGQMPAYIEKCNLNKLFLELDLYSTERQKVLTKNQIKFTLKNFSDIPENTTIYTDKEKFKQIFIKLIDNAFKFTDAGKVEIGCKSGDNHSLIFYVADTGIGIPSDKQDVIFEHFAQVDYGNSRMYGGIGLGLSVVKGLVRLLGGNIWLESQPGTGSTFFFTVQTKIKNIHLLKPLTIKLPEKYHFKNKTILIVEDDLYSTQYLKEILTSTGSNIIYACYGREAVKLILSQPVDLVLMDIRLPDMDGYEVTRQIRQFKPDLKIIAQTAFSLPNERQKALDAGCNEYINKPTDQTTLLYLINQQIN